MEWNDIRFVIVKKALVWCIRWLVGWMPKITYGIVIQFVWTLLCTGTAPAFSEFGSSVRVCCGGCMSKKFVHSQWTNKRPCVFEWFRVLLSQDWIRKFGIGENVTFPSSANCGASGDVGKGPSLCQSKPAGCQEAEFPVQTNIKGHLLANTSRKSTKHFVWF